jgi:hypothetical protein
MKNFIVTFGFNSEDGWLTTKSKPIPAENEEEAGLKLKDQFESYEGMSCEIYSVDIA